MTDVEALRRLLTNAAKRERPDIADACRRRIFELEGVAVEDPIERRLWEAVAAYEQILFETHGRRQRASYTRRKIAKKGAVATLTDWALDAKPTPGFEALSGTGMGRFTGEFVVVEFGDQFSAEAVSSARKKLEDAGVDLPE